VTFTTAAPTPHDTTMPNRHVTISTEISRAEFIGLFDHSAHGQLAALLDRPGVLGIVCFENLQLDASHAGDRTAVVYGPGCTYKTLEDVLGGHLGDVPNQIKYPTQHHEKPVDGVDLPAAEMESRKV
jgi:hypothetical protein